MGRLGSMGSSADGVPRAGTPWNCPPLASTMAERPHMQAGAPARTEGKGFGAPGMHLRALEMQVIYHAASVVWWEGTVHSSALTAVSPQRDLTV